MKQRAASYLRVAARLAFVAGVGVFGGCADAVTPAIVLPDGAVVLPPNPCSGLGVGSACLPAGVRCPAVEECLVCERGVYRWDDARAECFRGGPHAPPDLEA